MIELLAFLGYFLANLFLKKSVDEYTYIITINSLTSMLIIFVIFMRILVKICLNRMYRINKRYSILCIIYFLLILTSCLAVMYFNGDLFKPYEYTKITNILQGCLYFVLVSLFLIEKILDFQQVKLMGNVYLLLNIIDLIVLSALTLTDCLVTPQILVNSKVPSTLVQILLLILAIINVVVLHFREYWEHKTNLLKMMSNLIKEGCEDVIIVPQEKNIKGNKFMEELSVVLKQAPFRILEMNDLIIKAHKYLLKEKRRKDQISRFLADFNSIIILNLMKRDWDFSYLPSFMVNFIQKYFKKRGKENRRGL